MDDHEMWDLATELLRQYPEEAAFIAAQRADAFLDQGEMDAFALRVKITKRINSLERPTANS